MWRKTLKSTVAQTALCCTAMAVPAHAQMTPSSGDMYAFSGDINAFSGDINAFSGDINPFSGDLNPFQGDVYPFYGDISPFWGDISPFWGDINPFADGMTPSGGDINPFWGDINPFENGQPVTHTDGLAGFWHEAGVRWGAATVQWKDATQKKQANGTGNQKFNQLHKDLQEFSNFLSENWAATYESATGKNFDQDFLNPLLNRFGIDLNDRHSVRDVNDAQWSVFFLELYDELMMFSGMDMPDHWMPAINWTPTITQDQGDGEDARVGLLDMRVSTNDDNIDYLYDVGGYEAETSAHGAAVASLIAARHDGEGVMGIAPQAKVFAYNPFDETGTTNIDDVVLGINTLANHSARVINMSLGTPNYTLSQTMADALSQDGLSPLMTDVVIVKAAGNEGMVQTEDVVWGDTGLGTDNLLIVGSVDLNGEISSFSNQPGTACITDAQGNCDTMLMNRFIVAPGEMILVSDNNGGTMRASGTSFAAPLVTGAISLLHDRWPWLRRDADTTTEIILQTAQDLGEEGVDPVYGHGMLDVEASQSPIDFDQLVVFYKETPEDELWTSEHMDTTSLQQAIVTPGVLDMWEAEGSSITAFETINGTWRDFNIPLSSLILDDPVLGISGYEQQQTYVTQRMVAWAQGEGQGNANGQGQNNGNGNGQHKAAFTGTTDQSFSFYNFTSAEGDVSVVAGQGFAAHALTTTTQAGSHADHDPLMGGTNPFLGFASGGSFGHMALRAGKNTAISFGMTTTAFDQDPVDPLTGRPMQEFNLIGDRNALAGVVEIAHEASDRLTLAASVTALEELNGVLGAQGAGILNLNNGSHTTSLTVTSIYDLTTSLSFTASMTAGFTRDNGDNAVGLSVSDENVVSSAFQLTAAKAGVLNKNDRFSLSFIQPLHVEAGGLEFNAAQVVDRSTGQVENVAQEWSMAGQLRHLAGEAEYAVPVFKDRMTLGAFGRYDHNALDANGRFNAVSAGARLTIQY